MPLPKNRSTRYKKMPRKTTKGTKFIFVRRKAAAKSSCAVCKRQLAGVSFGSKTEKSVSRKFGGHLCHVCSMRVIKDALRVREGAKSIDNVDLVYKKYVEQMVKQ